MKNEKEALLMKIRQQSKRTKPFSDRFIERHVASMQPQDEEMRRFLWSYLSNLHTEDCRKIYSDKIASLVENKKQQFAEDFFQCLKNDATAGKKTVMQVGGHYV